MRPTTILRKTPSKEELIARMRKMQELGADIPKIAVMPLEHGRSSDTFVCHGRNETMLCRPPGYYNVYGRTGGTEPYVWGSLWLSTDIWCGGESICTGTD